MIVRDLIQALSQLDLDKEIEIGMYQKGLKSYLFRNGCTIHEEHPTGDYIILPNESGNAECK